MGLRLVVTNPEAAAGGADRTAHAPTQADYTGLEEKLKQQLSQAALQEIQAKLSPDEKIVSGTLKLMSVVQEKREPEVGLPSDSLKLTMRAEFRAWHIQNKDIARIVEIALNANLEAGMTEVSGSVVNTDLDQPQIQNDVARWNIQTSRTIQRVWDKESIISIVLGRRPDQATQLLTKNLGLDNNPLVEVEPGWWPFLPVLPFRIDVRVQ